MRVALLLLVGATAVTPVQKVGVIFKACGTVGGAAFPTLTRANKETSCRFRNSRISVQMISEILHYRAQRFLDSYWYHSWSTVDRSPLWKCSLRLWVCSLPYALDRDAKRQRCLFQMLQNEHLPAKAGIDTAKAEPPKFVTMLANTLQVVQLLQGMLEKGKQEKQEEQVQFAAYKQCPRNGCFSLRAQTLLV